MTTPMWMPMRMGVGAPDSSVGIDTHTVFVHQLPAKNTRQRDQQGRDNRQSNAPRAYPGQHILIAQQPIKGNDRQRHYRDQRVAPGGNKAPDLLYRYQIDQANKASAPAAQRANAGQPQAGAGPKFIGGSNIREVCGNQRHQRGHRKVNQHGVNGVAGNSRAAGDGRMRHKFYPEPKAIKKGLAVAFAAALTGCSGPQSALDPAGPAAEVIAWLWWGMFGFFTLVLFVVLGLWLYAMQRNHAKVSPADAIRSTNRWIIGGGIILPLITIIVLLGAGIPAGQHVLTLADETTEPLHIDVHAHRWWWEFRYPNTEVITANELTIPVDTPIEVKVYSDNVIHAFWVPRLGGKIDVVPGRANRLRLRASEVGTMRGQCAEFCGTGHAHMVFQVKVLSKSDYAAWQQRQQQDIVVAPEHQSAAQAFTTHCGECHRVKGVTQGTGAPDLSNIGARRLMGASPRGGAHVSIAQWLNTHPTWLQRESTPLHSEITPEQQDAIATWLETLD